MIGLSHLPHSILVLSTFQLLLLVSCFSLAFDLGRLIAAVHALIDWTDQSAISIFLMRLLMLLSFMLGLVVFPGIIEVLLAWRIEEMISFLRHRVL